MPIKQVSVTRITAVMKMLITSKGGAKRESSTVSIKKKKIIPGVRDQEPPQADASFRHFFEGQGEHYGNRYVISVLHVPVLFDCHNISKNLELLTTCLTQLTPRYLGPGRQHQ